MSVRKFLLPILAVPLFAAACGDQVQIPSGTVARQLTTNGLEKKLYQPGAYRMDTCGASACPMMIVLQTGLSTEQVEVDTVFLPKSNVDLADVKLAMQFHVRQTEQAIDEVFANVKPEGKDQRFREITADAIYKVYLQRIVPNIVIAVLRDYTVEDVLSNVDKISIAATNAIRKELANQPIEVTEVGFPNGIGKPPDEVLKVKRQLYVVSENISRQIKELQGQLEVEKQRQIVQQLRVNNDVANAKVADMPVAQYMYMKNMERFADEHVPLGMVPNSVTP